MPSPVRHAIFEELRNVVLVPHSLLAILAVVSKTTDILQTFLQGAQETKQPRIVQLSVACLHRLIDTNAIDKVWAAISPLITSITFYHPYRRLNAILASKHVCVSL